MILIFSAVFATAMAVVDMKDGNIHEFFTLLFVALLLFNAAEQRRRL